ncbi:MAG: dihydrodipicolinate synthase family protein [Alphaproteobacteria bacterium 64-11]|nr:dihydrodipicolinate synthase family protein [Alphaproteobacteria bacterium]OJU13516.1 MAG: dihydrodipicolinate synthase family protein [Alphaproteobacteria bacterium 64-11]
MKLDHTANGVYSIAPTPFHEDGGIDWNSVDRMTDFYFEAGCNGFTILGVLGEASKMDAEEALALAARVIRRAAGKPIIVGVSAAGFAAMRALSRKVMDMGAAAVMVAPGAGLRTDDQIAAYFRNAVEAIGEDVPWVLQDYPHSTGVVMSNNVVRRVVTENPSLAVLKHEDWPGLDKITALREWEKDGSMRRISILVGNNGLFLDFELDRGVDGANTGYAFPDMLVEMVKLSKAGRRDEAHDLFDAHLPLLRYDHQPGVGLAVRKYVLKRRGVLSSAAMRKPAPAFSAETRAEVDYLLTRLAMRDPRATQ